MARIVNVSIPWRVSKPPVLRLIPLIFLVSQHLPTLHATLQATVHLQSACMRPNQSMSRIVWQCLGWIDNLYWQSAASSIDNHKDRYKKAVLFVLPLSWLTAYLAAPALLDTLSDTILKPQYRRRAWQSHYMTLRVHAQIRETFPVVSNLGTVKSCENNHIVTVISCSWRCLQCSCPVWWWTSQHDCSLLQGGKWYRKLTA